MTQSGGINDLGTVFKIMPNGSGYAKLLDFNGTANGKNPNASLISDGTYLYGMTQAGGTNDFGTVFKLKPNGTGYMKLLDFDGTFNGKSPLGSLSSDETFLYGMTFYGGLNNLGTVFKIALTLTAVHDINAGIVNLVAYPNPTSGMFTIEHHALNNPFIITDYIGKSISSGVLTGKRTIVDLTKYKSGIYILKLDAQTVQLIKQ